MAMRRGNPQLEDGHTRIANELLEALIGYPFTGGELKVVLAVIRLTYGWQTKARPIKQRDLARLTGLDERQIRRVLGSLRQQAVVWRDRTSRPHRFQLNKRYYGWKQLPAALVQEAVMAARLEAQRRSAPANRSALSAQPDTTVRVEPDTGVPPITKERKERVLKESTPEPAVENFLHRFERFLNRSLTVEEHRLIQRLAELSPHQAEQLLQDVVHAMSHTSGGRFDGNGSVPSHD
jgi:phage replication O-like protein O